MSFVTFLEKGSLITRKECAEILGLDATQSSTNFHLELEDYLIGVLDTCSELARLAPNSVVAGNMGKFLKFAEPLPWKIFPVGLEKFPVPVPTWTWNLELLLTTIISEQPDQIHKFLCDMAEGYSQLNLKNDRLRKRYDVLKEWFQRTQRIVPCSAICAGNQHFRNHKQYDVQKVESVVYDLQVRGVTKRKKPNVEEEQNMNE